MEALLLGEGLAEAVVARVTIILTLALLVCMAMRRSPAAMRHCVLAAAATASLAAPFLTAFGPTWALPSVGLMKSAEPVAPSPALPAIEVAQEHEADPGSGREPMAASPRPTIATPVAASAAPWTWSQRVLAIWAVGAVVAAVPALVVGIRLRRLANASQPLVEVRWNAMVDDLRSRLGGVRCVRLLQSDAVASPMTWGVFRPVIVLPTDSEAWPEGRLQAVLMHELAHVARRDAMAQMPARLACVAYWFHPMAWWTAARMLVERERACDDLVLAAGWRGVDYAQRLLEVARGLRGRPGFAGVAAMARTSQVEDRVRAILDGSRDHRPLGRRGVLALFAATAALALPLASAKLVAQAPQAPAEAPKAETMTVSGRVLDPDGKPVAGAKVAILGLLKQARATTLPETRRPMLGTGASDGDGRFLVQTPRISGTRYERVTILAGGVPGFCLGWSQLDPGSVAPTTDVALQREQPVEVRFLTPDGQPAPGVAVRVVSLGLVAAPTGEPVAFSRQYNVVSVYPQVPIELADLWPGAMKTDAEGRIRLAQLGRDVAASLEVDDPRFVSFKPYVATAEATEGVKRIDLGLISAWRISGIVTSADDRRPIPNTLVEVSTKGRPTGGYYTASSARTDAQGRYEVRTRPGVSMRIMVHPPPGTPYLTRVEEFPNLPDGTSQTFNLAIPRGVLIEGRVADREGRPVADATIFYTTHADEPTLTAPRNLSDVPAAVASGPDGRFAIAVEPGKGLLNVCGPTQDYALKEMIGAYRFYVYAHAFLPYDVQPGPAPVNLDAVLDPGVKIVGRVEDPGGLPVENAEIITMASFAHNSRSWGGSPTTPVRDGRFEIPGATLGRPMKCWFLDVEHGLGAVVELDAAHPATVRLQPMGAVRMRVVDLEGRPNSTTSPGLSIVAALGPPKYHTGQGIPLTDEERKRPLAEEGNYGMFDRRNYRTTLPKPDADGRAVFPKLIPGATYRIYEPTLNGGVETLRWRDFTVAPGQTLNLGDVRVKPSAGS